MKKLIFSLAFLLLSVFSIQAQTEEKLNTGNASIYLCTDYNNETGNFTKLFNGFKGKGTSTFKVVIFIQDFKPDVVHKLQIKIVDPEATNILGNQSSSFILKSNTYQHIHRQNTNATFVLEGVYQVQAWVDGKFVQYFNFYVGNSVAKNDSEGNVAMVVCTDYDGNNNNISGIIMGLKKPETRETLLLVRLQDFPLNEVNKAVVKLISPSGENVLIKKEATFTHGNSSNLHYYSKRTTIEFSESGVYQFQVEVNGKIVQYLNFSVGAN